jgi:hypothetical protein
MVLRSSVPLVPILLAGALSLGCVVAPPGSDGGRARGNGTAVAQQDAAAVPVATDAPQEPGDVEATDAALEIPVGVTEDAGAEGAGGGDAVDAGVDAAPDVVEASGPSACVLGASALGGCFLP